VGEGHSSCEIGEEASSHKTQHIGQVVHIAVQVQRMEAVVGHCSMTTTKGAQHFATSGCRNMSKDRLHLADAFATAVDGEEMGSVREAGIREKKLPGSSIQH